jgi:hypothetical protein
MAKASFHKSQRVFVRPVGTWALVERVVPQWVKDVDEPLRIAYDCGLGRLFQAHELVSEQAMMRDHKVEDDEDELFIEQWRIDRRALKWRSYTGPGDMAPAATLPVVATDDGNSGGWRVSAAEYDRDPHRIEHQARMISHTPDLLRAARRLSQFATDHPDSVPDALRPLVADCAIILRGIYRLDSKEMEAAK